MKNDLAKNIKAFRKEKGLTQEQLAEVFDVTVGAVHKWEVGLSTPELPLIMQMADFFDTSLDVLIGFEARDNRISILAKRLRTMSQTKDPEGPSEAEKALKKYPHNFSIVFESAIVFLASGVMLTVNQKYLMRAAELFEEAVKLISQNTSPDINETVICGYLATVYDLLGQKDNALQIYKANNAGGIFNIKIGMLLAHDEKDYREAEGYLSYGMLNLFSDRVNLSIAKILFYIKTGDLQEARAIIEYGLKANDLYRKDDSVTYMDRVDCMYLTGLAYVELMSGKKNEAVRILKKAKKIADRFDLSPDYDAKKLRFITLNESILTSDIGGEKCTEAVEYCISSLRSKGLADIWADINK